MMSDSISTITSDLKFNVELLLKKVDALVILENDSKEEFITSKSSELLKVIDSRSRDVQKSVKMLMKRSKSVKKEAGTKAARRK